jgi:hypothetical protein
MQIPFAYVAGKRFHPFFQMMLEIISRRECTVKNALAGLAFASPAGQAYGNSCHFLMIMER